MTRLDIQGIRGARLALVGAILGTALGAGSVVASDAADADLLAPQIGGPDQVTRIIGLDPAAAAGMLEDHFRLEHRADLVRIDPAVGAARLAEHFEIEHRADLVRIDPVVGAARLAEHFEIEHRADLMRGTLVDPVTQAAWLAHHFEVEHRS